MIVYFVVMNSGRCSKYILAECDVVIGEYLPEVFVHIE